MTQTELKQIIWQVVAAIPKGRVMTYGQIASMCGYPGYARYVGQVLKQLPEGTELPWHRVINAKGEISFPAETQAHLQQKARLLKEGVIFTGNRIKLRDYGWQGFANNPKVET